MYNMDDDNINAAALISDDANSNNADKECMLLVLETNVKQFLIVNPNTCEPDQKMDICNSVAEVLEDVSDTVANINLPVVFDGIPEKKNVITVANDPYNFDIDDEDLNNIINDFTSEVKEARLKRAKKQPDHHEIDIDTFDTLLDNSPSSSMMLDNLDSDDFINQVLRTLEDPPQASFTPNTSMTYTPQIPNYSEYGTPILNAQKPDTFKTKRVKVLMPQVPRQKCVHKLGNKVSKQPTMGSAYTAAKKQPTLGTAYTAPKMQSTISSAHTAPQKQPIIDTAYTAPKKQPIISTAHTAPKKQPTIGTAKITPKKQPAKPRVRAAKNSYMRSRITAKEFSEGKIKLVQSQGTNESYWLLPATVTTSTSAAGSMAQTQTKTMYTGPLPNCDYGPPCTTRCGISAPVFAQLMPSGEMSNWICVPGNIPKNMRISHLVMVEDKK